MSSLAQLGPPRARGDSNPRGCGTWRRGSVMPSAVIGMVGLHHLRDLFQPQRFRGLSLSTTQLPGRDGTSQRSRQQPRIRMDPSWSCGTSRRVLGQAHRAQGALEFLGWISGQGSAPRGTERALPREWIHGFIYFPVSVPSGVGRWEGIPGWVLKEALWRLLEFPPLRKRKQTENSPQVFQQTNKQTNRGCFSGANGSKVKGTRSQPRSRFGFVGYFQRTEHPDWDRSSSAFRECWLWETDKEELEEFHPGFGNGGLEP